MLEAFKPFQHKIILNVANFQEKSYFVCSPKNFHNTLLARKYLFTYIPSYSKGFVIFQILN